MSISYFQQANQLVRQGKLEEAINLYRTAIERNPNLYVYYENLGEALAKIGDVDTAISVYYRAVELNPNSISSYYMLGRLLGQRGELDAALKAYEHVKNSKLDFPNMQKEIEQISKNKSDSLLINPVSVFDCRQQEVPYGFPPDLNLPPLIGERNNYTFIEEKLNNTIINEYNLSVSILIPFYGNFQILKRIFEAIASQTYNLNLVEIVVIYLEEITLSEEKRNEQKKLLNSTIDTYREQGIKNITLTHSIRNKLAETASVFQYGIQAANHEYLIFLDHDLLPSKTLVEKFMQYFHISNNIILLGNRYLQNSTHKEEESESKFLGKRNVIYEDSNYLKDDNYPFRAFSSANFACSRELFCKIGNFDESFQHNGFQDKEFGYRVFNQGYYFIPVFEASGTHVNSCEIRNQTNKNAQDNEYILIQKCPIDWHRKVKGISYEIPKVSIYIPCYNNGRFIKEAVDSVLDQDYQDLEICICDDGSTDCTLEVLENNYKNNPKVRWVSQENGGIGKASNTAVTMCKGMYIGQLDSDDVLKPGAVRKLATYLDKNPSIGCVYSACERIDIEGNYLQDEYNWPQFSREKLLMTSIVHHFRMFRKYCWMRTEGFSEDLVNAVDYDMFLKLSEICSFYHINEKLYCRRIHGNNTSVAQEKYQDKNTLVVINRSLKRMDLSNRWEPYLPDPSQPRKVSFKRKQTSVFFFPDYRKSNPYQDLLYRELPPSYYLYVGDIDRALEAVKNAQTTTGKVIFHLHWTNYILRQAKSLEHANRIKEQYIKTFSNFVELGGSLIWTIHNVLPHECQYEEQELEMRNWICKLTDKIHIHSRSSLTTLKNYFDLPEEKIKILPHGNYVGIYPNHINLQVARQSFDFSKHEFVFLFLGQIRAYKGIGDLIEAFKQLHTSYPDIRLIIAGKVRDPIDITELKSTSKEIYNKIILIDKYILGNELQYFYNACNVVVLPYRNVLTSGSVLQALSFKRPVIAPQVNMIEEILTEGYNGFMYKIKDIQSLVKAMKTAISTSAEDREQLTKNSFESIKHLTWGRIADSLFNEKG